MLSAPRWASLPYDPPRDISLPRGPFLGCVGLSLQILPSHDLWSHLCTCFLNFNCCRAQAHVKLDFISISSAGPSLGPRPGECRNLTCRERDRLYSSVPTRPHPYKMSLQAQSRLSPPPLPECNLPKPLIKSILEVIKVSPKICSFSKLSLKQNLLSGEI